MHLLLGRSSLGSGHQVSVIAPQTEILIILPWNLYRMIYDHLKALGGRFCDVVIKIIEANIWVVESAYHVISDY